MPYYWGGYVGGGVRLTSQQIVNHIRELGQGGNACFDIIAWYSKQPSFFGCLRWMIPNRYIKNVCFTIVSPFPSIKLFRVSLRSTCFFVKEFVFWGALFLGVGFSRNPYFHKAHWSPRLL